MPVLATSWSIILLCAVNLLFMHYNIMFTCTFECKAVFVTFIDNVFGVAIDTVAVFVLSYFLTLKSQKIALTITYFLSLFWSFCNVLYSRFFHHYLSLSAIRQGDALADTQILRSVIDGLCWVDCCYFVSIVIFILIIRKVRIIKYPVSKTTFIVLALLLIDLFTFILYGFLSHRHYSYVLESIEHRHISTFCHLVNPNDSHFRRGSLRTIIYEVVLDFQGVVDLSDEQIASIRCASNRHRTEGAALSQAKTKNLIFILVESYMSFVSDMKIDGREVTPFLNALKNDSSVYFNSHMKENVTIGESSDGQFIYMTGLLPLRSVITVSKARNISLPGLPKAIERRTTMVIPTISSLWNQIEMCNRYGVDSLFTSDNYRNGKYSVLNDNQVLQMAMDIDSTLKEPFFFIVLTMTMHQPYTQQIDETFPVDEKIHGRELACYTNVCHYTDRQIKRFFEHLKQVGLYDNSLIVIAADHPTHNTDFGGRSKEIPLYLVNIPKQLKERMWSGQCNQFDVYPTLLDLLGIDNGWRGLGHSLLSPIYTNSISSEQWDVSEWIIRGDYFSKIVD